MLKTLIIKNFILIESLELELSPSLNIITGETGSGKSMLADALTVLFGGRASSDFVRQGESKAIIEGAFSLKNNSPIKSILCDSDIECEGNELILRREISAKSSSRCFINDTPVQVSLLKQIGEFAADFHGQHEHQSLLKNENHLAIFDEFVKSSELLSDYTAIYASLQSKNSEYQSLVSRERKIKSEIDVQRFKLEEIEKLKLKPNEDIELEAELKIFENAETLYNLTNELHSSLYEGDNSVHDRLFSAEKNLAALAGIDSSFADFLNDVSSALVIIDETAKFARSYADNIEFNAQRIEDIRLRLNEIKGLRKKYGSVSEILEIRERLVEELKLAESFDEEINKLADEIIRIQERLGTAAEVLSERRKNHSEDFCARIINEIAELGMPHADFKVSFQRVEILSEDFSLIGRTVCRVGGKVFEAFPDGIDSVEFLISTNKGESVKSLNQTASGGEISRIMLALKSIAAEGDKTPLLIFDEIDIGISGRIARKAGLSMKKLARKHQIIAITHLPQIAGLGDLNIAVEKIESNGRTSARAKALSNDEKLREVAKLISGENITDTALESARELIAIEDSSF